MIDTILSQFMNDLNEIGNKYNISINPEVDKISGQLVIYTNMLHIDYYDENEHDDVDYQLFSESI